MTSSDQLSCLEPWLYRPTTFADTWLSDTQTLTLALQQSLSSPDRSSLSISPLLANSGSGSDIDPPPAAAPAVAPPRRSSIPATAKPTKRRSRASKRSTTTFITADPANFRQMVQQVTGVRFSGGFPAVVKPEPQRAATEYLPTLDTSSFLLSQMCPTIDTSSAAVAEGGGGGSGGFDFEAFSCFPTLESWKVM